MLRHTDYTRERLSQLVGTLFNKIYAARKAVSDLAVSPVSERISFSQAQSLQYRPVALGEQFGPAFATYWFKGQAQIPPEWAGKRVDLLWISHSEATLWLDGKTVQGLNSGTGLNYGTDDRTDAVLCRAAKGKERLSFMIEMACNTAFGVPLDRLKHQNISPFVLDKCELAVFDESAWQLYYDYKVLQELEAEMAREGATMEKAWAGKLLYELNRFANLYDADDRSSWAKAGEILKDLYQERNGSFGHEATAIGHAHIDTAWLWPIAETHRKCERTFSSQLRYMEEYPEYNFACSQAYQYAAIKEKNPELYGRIKQAVEKGQWIPVGGTWVEPDCNIPSGESLVRQFLWGQRFFQKEFGQRCLEFWNPDVFGYNGQLPQLMRLAGIEWFLTQKLSWNRFNKPQYHTFVWQGIDGSKVLAHFPPVGTYNAIVDVAELRKNVANFKDHDRTNHSLILFGHGDGGGGPTKDMLERLRRAGDLQGLPRTKVGSPHRFFEELERTFVDRPEVIGELYFEYHRGTYTSQAAVKRAMRKAEILLHDVELVGAVAHRASGNQYPTAELEELWKRLLVNQFHDILPGSSIKEVYEDVARDFEVVFEKGTELLHQGLAAIEGGGASAAPDDVVPVNTTSFFRREVAERTDGKLVLIEVPALGVGRVRSAEADEQVSLTESGGTIVLENCHLKALLSSQGQLISLVHKETGREALSHPGNQLRLYRDQPAHYDAWEIDPYHLETEEVCPPAHAHRVSREQLRAQVTFERQIGQSSTMTQSVRLDAGCRRLEFHCRINWQESHRLLKVVFPVAVKALESTGEMQFGCVSRPTHFNTTYDLARFEIPAHKWIDMSEPGFGVALLSESKYGYSAFGEEMRISLMRSPKLPDPNADMGEHEFAYAIMPHRGTWREAEVVAEAYKFNMPVLWRRAKVDAEAEASNRSWFQIACPDLVIDTVKKAEDSNALVVRLYECHGGRGTARLSTTLPFDRAVYCNILEDDLQPVTALNPHQLEIPYSAFKIISLKLY